MRRQMHRLLVLASLVALFALAAPAAAQTNNFCAPGQQPQFQFGFSALAARLGEEIVGEPLECEHYNPDGDAFQQTTLGEFFYDSSTNTPVFSNASRHWALTGRGLVTWTGLAQLPPEDAEVITGSVTAPSTTPRSEQPVTASLVGVQNNIVGTVKMENAIGGNMTVSVQAAGFTPVAGGHRLAITDIGRCVAPSFSSAGEEIVLLPDLEIYPNGTTLYQVLVERPDEDVLFDEDGSALVLYESGEASSAIIACAELVPLEGGLIIDDSTDDILRNPPIYLGRAVAVSGTVVQLLGSHVFTVRSEGAVGGELLVLADPAAIPVLELSVGDAVVVTGTVITLTNAEIQRQPDGGAALGPWAGNPTVVAQAVELD